MFSLFWLKISIIFFYNLYIRLPLALGVTNSLIRLIELLHLQCLFLSLIVRLWLAIRKLRILLYEYIPHFSHWNFQFLILILNLPVFALHSYFKTDSFFMLIVQMPTILFFIYSLFVCLCNEIGYRANNKHCHYKHLLL